MDEAIMTATETASEIELLSEILTQLNTCASLLGVVCAFLVILLGAFAVCVVWRVVCNNVLIF